MEKSEIKTRTMQGIKWLGIVEVIRYFSRWGIGVALARLLYPKDFGLYGMTFIFIGLLDIIASFGFAQAIIQKRDLDDEALNSAFWAVVMGSVGFYAIIFVTSPWVGMFYNKDLIVPIMRVTGIIVLLSPISFIHRTILQKRIEFRKLSITEYKIALISGFVSIILAVLNYGVWSLVIGPLIGHLCGILMFLRLVSWKPRFSFNPGKLKELFAFGKNIVGLNFINYIGKNIDYLLIGKFIGAVNFGHYSLAYNLINIPKVKISQLINKVFFPALSELQQDEQTLISWYLESVKYVALVTIPMVVGLTIVAPEFVRVVYGPKWIPAIIPLRLLCIVGIIGAVESTASSLILAKGRPDVILKLEIGFMVGLTTSVFLGLSRGINGVAFAISLFWLAYFVFVSRPVKNRFIGITHKTYYKTLIPSLKGCLIMIVPLLLVKAVSEKYVLPDPVVLSVLIALGGLLYIYIIRKLEPKVYSKFKTLVASMFKK